PNPWAAQPPYAMPAAPKKKTKILPVMIIVGVFLVAIPVVAALFSGDPQDTSTAPPTTMPTDPTPSPTDPPPTQPPTQEPTPTGGHYTPGPPDLNPEQPPMANSYEDIHNALERNPLYGTTMGITDCSFPNFDAANATNAELEEHLNTLMGCFVAAWSPPLGEAGFTTHRPSVIVYSPPVMTGCGEIGMGAFFCAADQQIYVSDDLIILFPSSMQHMRYFAEEVVAHEFGHLVQNRSMVLWGIATLMWEAKTEAEAWEWSRRLEFQADCYAGLFLNSIAVSSQMTEQDRRNLNEMWSILGSDEPYTDDHGTSVNRVYWTNQGFNSTDIGLCNTYVVPSDRVG
ncbi:MAG: neutral zinc metallopeptidase, partial [Propionibacteriaceae bacterium]|nr:neutral zinc metallopeptidase [Propionibacteriaceae bacterium]